MQRTVVVTGATGGLGSAVARAFGAEGDHVALGARDADALAEVAEDVEEAGGDATAVRADVRDEFDVEWLMESASRAGDGIDVVVPCAAVYHGDPGETPLDAEPYSTFDDTMRTNVRGVFAAVKEALPHFGDEGRVLVPTGRVGEGSTAGYGAYAVSKAAAEAVAAGFAADVDHPVGMVDPGSVATPLSAGEGRAPADVAGLFVWAAGLDADAVDGAMLTLDDWDAVD